PCASLSSLAFCSAATCASVSTRPSARSWPLSTWPHAGRSMAVSTTAYSIAGSTRFFSIGFLLLISARASSHLAGRGESDLDAAVVQVRLAITHALHEAVRSVDLVFHAAGTNAVYAHNRLERHFRDIHVAVQHAACELICWRPARRSSASV